MKRKVLLICDHNLDPRLRRKVKWFQSADLLVDIFHESKAGWLGEFDDKERIITKLPKDFADYELVYVSGAKIYLDYFFFFLKMRLKGIEVICEIPDLPLRRNSNVENRIIAFFFKQVVSLFASKIIVTSEAFMKFLPKNKPYLEFENLPTVDIAQKFLKLRETKSEHKKTRIAFVGAIRYLEQLQLLIKFANERKNLIDLLIYGGPESKLQEVMKLENTTFNDNIKYFGIFNYENDIIDIYKEIDMVYSVYDRSQLNVQLALPNKLYEATLSDKPIIVAEGTYLCEVVSKKKLGLCLPTKLNEYNEFEKKLDEYLSSKNQINSLEYTQETMIKIENQKKNLLEFVTA